MTTFFKYIIEFSIAALLVHVPMDSIANGEISAFGTTATVSGTPGL